MPDESSQMHFRDDTCVNIVIIRDFDIDCVRIALKKGGSFALLICDNLTMQLDEQLKKYFQCRQRVITVFATNCKTHVKAIDAQ